MFGYTFKVKLVFNDVFIVFLYYIHIIHIYIHTYVYIYIYIYIHIYTYIHIEQEQNRITRLRTSITFQTSFGVWPSSVEMENTMFFLLVCEFIQKS